jgi:hypothetical protein
MSRGIELRRMITAAVEMFILTTRGPYLDVNMLRDVLKRKSDIKFGSAA